MLSSVSPMRFSAGSPPIWSEAPPSGSTSSRTSPISARRRSRGLICSKSRSMPPWRCSSPAGVHSSASSATSLRSMEGSREPRLRASCWRSSMPCSSWVGATRSLSSTTILSATISVALELAWSLEEWQKSHRLSVFVLHRGLDRSRPEAGIDRSHGEGELLLCLHRHRESLRTIPDGSQEISKSAARSAGVRPLHPESKVFG